MMDCNGGQNAMDEVGPLKLRYGEIILGDILDAYCGEFATQTWFGEFFPCLTGGSTPERQLRDLIAFCKEWHVRLDAGEDVDAAEFDRFADLLKSRLWNTESPDGTVDAIDAPVFYDNHITWRRLPFE
jgi:hypothetical protein